MTQIASFLTQLPSSFVAMAVRDGGIRHRRVSGTPSRPSRRELQWTAKHCIDGVDRADLQNRPRLAVSR